VILVSGRGRNRR